LGHLLGLGFTEPGRLAPDTAPEDWPERYLETDGCAVCNDLG
jgi:hypothetical protein